LKNTLVIIGGRFVDKLEDPLVALWGREIVSKQDLSPFNLAESKDYFAHTEIGATLDEDMKEKLYILTGGHPILISLAEYWLRRDMPINHVTVRPLQEIRSLNGDELKQVSAEFQASLVNNILNLTTIDQALLMMAYLRRRFNDDILQITLEVTPEQAQKISAELRHFPFFRPRSGRRDYALHDVMRDLVVLHSWPIVDPHGLQRRRLAQRVVEQYYVPRIESLEKQIQDIRSREGDRKSVLAVLSQIEDVYFPKWQLEADRLYYEMELDPEKGYKYFEDLFEQALGSSHLRQCDLLLGAVDEAKLEANFQVHTNLKIKRARWQWLSDKSEDREKAENYLRKILKNSGLDKRNKLEAISTLAGRTHDLAEAIRLRSRCVRLAEQQGGAAAIAQMYRLGLAYRRTGQWDKAREWYEKARQKAEEIKDRPLVAEVISHLAYIERLEDTQIRLNDWLAWRYLYDVRARPVSGNWQEVIKYMGKFTVICA